VIPGEPDAFAVPLKVGQHGGVGFAGECAVVSAEDRELSRYRWSKDSHGYARRRTKGGGTIRLHRDLLGLPHGAPDGLVVDHINGDRLDNRRENLRVCEQHENSQNRRSMPGTSSQYRGVSLRKGRGGYKGKPWTAYANRSRRDIGAGEGRLVHLGDYATEEEAAEVAAAWRREHMPFTVD
jgi:hypothetical protein